jgi:hypothetical protein
MHKNMRNIFEKIPQNSKESSREDFFRECNERYENNIDNFFERIKERMSNIDVNSLEGRRQIEELVGQENNIKEFLDNFIENTPYSKQEKKTIKEVLIGKDEEMGKIRLNNLMRVLTEGVDSEDEARIPNYERTKGIFYQEILKRLKPEASDNETLSEEKKWLSSYLQRITEEIKTGRFDISKELKEDLEEAA